MNTIVICLLVALTLVQTYVIAYMAWDKAFGCFTRAAFNMMYPVLRALGYSFIAGDIDKFKSFNSAYGHEKVNKMVARSVRSCVGLRSGELVFRVYSGDEFIIATKSKDIDAMMSRIKASFALEGMTITLVVVAETLDVTMVKVLDSKKGN